MLITESHDADLIDAIILDCDTPCYDDFNVRSWLSDQYNVALTNGTDFALFEWVPSTRSFIGHYMFASRGKEAFVAARQFLMVMFAVYGADLILGIVPEDRRDVSIFTRKLGFTFEGTSDTLVGKSNIFTMSRNNI